MKADTCFQYSAEELRELAEAAGYKLKSPHYQNRLDTKS